MEYSSLTRTRHAVLGSPRFSFCPCGANDRVRGMKTTNSGSTDSYDTAEHPRPSCLADNGGMSLRTSVAVLVVAAVAAACTGSPAADSKSPHRGPPLTWPQVE